MKCGVSTSCFYPEETLQGLSCLSNLGVSCVEVFLNTFCELSPEYANRIGLCLRQNNMHISALHPFTSGMETFFFATDYPTRIEDGYTLYRRYFSFCQMLHIPRFVFHGMHKGINFPFERYAEHYLRLREMAPRFWSGFFTGKRCTLCLLLHKRSHTPSGIDTRGCRLRAGCQASAPRRSFSPCNVGSNGNKRGTSAFKRFYRNL